MPVLIDLTRLLSRANSPAPTGIDRVELAYAKRYLLPDETAAAAFVNLYGSFLLPRHRAVRLVESLDARWSGEDGGQEHPEFRRVRDWLSRPCSQPEPRPAARGGPDVGSVLKPLRALIPAALTPASRAPQRALYLHTSHSGLDRPAAFAWLARRPDVKMVALLHDLIPTEYPEHCRPSQVARHKVRLETISRHASAVVVSTHDVAERAAQHWRRESLRVPDMVVAPLGLDPSFEAETSPLAAARPYFVVCGTIEARKNHLFLFEVWRELAREPGPQTPALVVIGSRGWGHEAPIDFLQRCEWLRPHVCEASGLPTSSVRQLIAGSRALLMPSFAEGFGLPVVEALSLGTPVVASDLLAHREVAGGRATLLDPLDGPGWRRAIVNLVANQRAQVDAKPFRPPAWADHFAAVDRLL